MDDTDCFRTLRIAWEHARVPLYKRGDRTHDYTVLRTLGKGGFGTVYLATDGCLTSRALKVFVPRPALGLEPLHEAEMMLAYGEHPGLPAVHAAWLEGGCAHIAMDCLPGKNLRAFLSACTWPLSLRFMVDILKQLLEILHYLHTRPVPVYHMDIKLTNLIVGNDDRLRLCDFGIAQCEAVGVWQPKRPDTIIGAWVSIPPERLTNFEAPLNPLADIYGAGVIGYMLATGRSPRSPFPHVIVSSSELDIPRLSETGTYGAFARAVNRATEFAPEDRFQTADEFLSALKDIR